MELHIEHVIEVIGFHFKEELFMGMAQILSTAEFHQAGCLYIVGFFKNSCESL